MNMKKFIAVLFSLAALSLAANVQVLPPVGADFSPDAPQTVQSLVRAAVSQSGNTPVEEDAEIKLGTSVMIMGSSFIVVCEQSKNGTVVATGKQKASNLDQLDVAIENAVKEAFGLPVPQQAAAQGEAPKANEPLPVNTSVITIEAEEKPAEPQNFTERKPTRNYKGYGLGVAFWYNYEHSYLDTEENDDGEEEEVTVKEGGDVDIAYAFRYAYIWETTWSGAIFFQSNTNVGFGDYFQLHETAMFGGRYYFGDGSIAPFVGAGIGLGVQLDTHYEHWSEIIGYGLAAGADLGLVMFRTSNAQLETGFHFDMLWDTFKSFGRHFGALTFYIGLNL